jgi:hypothetical protein
MRVLSIIILALMVVSCYKNNYYYDNNIAPTAYIYIDGELESETTLTYKLGEPAIKLHLSIEDDQSDFIITAINNDTQVELTVENDTVVYVTPMEKGNQIITIAVIDPYGFDARVNLFITVIDNYLPTADVTFKLLDNNNYEVNASGSYDPDGEIVDYHFDYGINSFSFHEPVVWIWDDHLEQNGGVTVTLTDDKGGKSEPKFFPLN